ncbi:MAG: hypothetical protein M3Z46_03020 [Actinomycetota bacterium]|nr:hypothetical protein [Actinomycetota bacterium]
MQPARPQPLSRRSVLLGGASAALLAACGSEKKHVAAVSPTSTRPADTTKYSLVTFTDAANSVEAGSPQRLTFGLGDEQGALVENGPERLAFDILIGNKMITHVDSALHRKGLSRGYYPVTFRPPTPGFYTARARIAGRAVEASFQVVRRIAIPRPGQPMVVADTPTVTDHRMVSPICTRTPACPLHEINLREALRASKPVALLIATPAYCQTAICGPVLDVLLSQQRTFGDQIQMIHAEVYADGKAAAADISNAKLALVLETFRLTFEPVLFLIRSDRVLARRLDTIFDEVELRAALRSVVA